MTIETYNGGVPVRTGAAANPNAVLTGSPELIIDLLAGHIDLAAARSNKLRVEGEESALRRVRRSVTEV